MLLFLKTALRKIPIFWQLYLTMLLALLSGLIIYSIIHRNIEGSTSISDFYTDTRYFVDIVNHISSQESDVEAVLRGVDLATTHNVTLLAEDQVQRVLNDNQQIGNYGGDIILEHNDGRLLGLYPIVSRSNIGHYNTLLVTDPVSPTTESLLTITGQADKTIQNEKASRSRLLGLVLMVSTLAAIAIGLYWQARRIQNYLLLFVHSGKEWLAGNTEYAIDTSLPAPLGTMARNHNQLISALYKKQQDQQMMINAISHELRTPLSKLHLSIDLMQRDGLGSDQKPSWEEMAGYVDELDQLTDQALTLSKLGAGATSANAAQSLEEVRLSPWLANCVERWSKLHNNRTIEFDAQSENCVVLINKIHLRMIIDNLLANAVKYSEQRIEIVLDIAGADALIIIADDGPGIPLEERDNVLMPFSRIDNSRSRKTGGYGIGLAVVNAIVQQYQMGFQLDTSRRLGGLEITLRVPVT